STANGVVSVASGRFADAAGNANADGADSNNTVTMTVNTVVTDTTAPRIAITSNASVLIAGQTALIAFALSEPSTSFDLADIDVSGGALSEFSGSGASYSAVFTPTAGAVATASLSVGDARFADASGNLNADGADADNSVMLAIRTLRPTIAIASDKTALALGDSASVSFTLSQASSDFSGADIVASGGILSGFAGSGMHYSATFTPFADSNANAVISVAGGTFVDSFGNANADGADADNRVAMAVDTRPPTVSVSIDRNTIGAGESALVTFTLSEASADFSNADVTAAGGTLSALSGGGAVYTATFTPAPAFVGTASLHVASGRLRDAAGNFNGDGADADNRVSVVINTVEPAPAPTVVLLDDLDNDGFFSRAELQGDADVAIYLPAGTRAGDVLTVSDGSATRRLVVGAEDLAGGIVNTSFAAPGVNAAITVTASVAPPGGLQGGAGADSARRGSGVDFTFTDISTDTGIVGDFITTDNTLVLGGTAESGELVTITVDGVAVGTAVAVDNRWTFDYSATPLPRGDHHVTASIGALAGETVSVIVQLFSADLDPSSDDGESNLDHITGNTTPNFVLHAQGIMQAGDTARLLDPNGTVIGHSLVTQGNLGAGSVDVPTRPLNDGVYTFLAQIIAPDGQVRVSQPVSVTIITDRDGVMPLTELAANGGDFNHDGVFDWQQNNVAQLPLTSLEAFAMNENAPAQSFGAIMAGNLATPGGAVALTANAQLLGVALVATPASLPSNTTAATPMMQFSVTGANQQALTDLDPGRAGLQTRVIIDLPAGVTANTFLKWDPVAMRWFNFVDDQRLDTLDDGATLIDANSDGKIDRVVVTLTDGGRGDADGQVNGMIVDPGMLAQVAATPVHSILLANGDRFYTTSAAEALQYAKGVANVYEGVRFDSLSDTPAARQMEARWQPFTEDWFFGASPTADPYLCYEATGGAGFRAAGAGAGIGVDFHLFTNADGMTQLLTPGEANTLGLAAKGYTSMGAQFNTTTSSAYSFDAEGYLIANRDSADVQTFVRSLASQYQHSSDAGFIEAVETHYLTQVTLIGVPHGTAASVGDLNAVFGTTFL
ncbi:MAG: Ig-like domain-containing protein, partial [Pseudomonadota bacterium]